MIRLWFLLGLLLLALLATIWVLAPTLLYREYTETKKFIATVGEGRVKDVKLSEMKRLQEDLFTIYYTPSYENLAIETIHLLKQLWMAIHQRLGLQLGAYAVALIPLAEGEGGAQIIGESVQPILITRPISSLRAAVEDEDKVLIHLFYVTPAHEATEHMISRKLYHDRAARWVGDGLAEYVSHVAAAASLPRHMANQLLEVRRQDVLRFIEKQGSKTYDLTKDFLVRTGDTDPFEITAYTGYSVSFAFWLQIVQRHGEGVIKVFWERVSQISRPSARDAARILSELTGEEIWTKLQNMDLQEVLQTLERAAGASP